jgi:hypothetical protein
MAVSITSAPGEGKRRGAASEPINRYADDADSADFGGLVLGWNDDYGKRTSKRHYACLVGGLAGEQTGACGEKGVFR